VCSSDLVLKINRRSEALRQASQGSRDFVEFLVKEIRNGQIDYFTTGGFYNASGVGSSPCAPIGASGALEKSTDPVTYAQKENRLGIINTDNVEECFYLGDSNNNYVGAGINSATGGTLLMQKVGVKGSSGATTVEVLNPPNFKINQLMFLIRPQCDPYTSSPCTAYGGYPDTQPLVVMMIQFTVQLPTGEQTQIYYQTSVSSNKYDIPH
jgi:hypothetical protein